MYNFDHIVQMSFDAVAIPSILNGTIRYNEFPTKTFKQLSKAYISRNSDTENSRLYEYTQDSLDVEGHPFAALENRSKLNIFAALEELAEQLLTTENNQIVCVYGKLLRFREITRYVDEDLLVCSYLAMRYKRFRKEHENFAWNIAIPHNNVQLRRIVEKGISENHFHLYGSAASFHLIWIELMNRVGNGDMLARLDKEFTERQRVVREHYSIDYLEEPFASIVLKVALLRVCIMRYYIGWKMQEEEGWLIKEILSGEMETQIYLRDIQGWIDGLKMWIFIECGKEEVDYALYRADMIGGITSEYTWVQANGG